MTATAEAARLTRQEIREGRQRELEAIAAAHGGVLNPHDVVEYAKQHLNSILHNHSNFVWDVDKAAYEHWVWRAREIIKMHVIVSEVVHKVVPMYVSLVSDRKPEGGYRGMDTVLADHNLRTEWLGMAIDDLEGWMDKYDMLDELSSVFRTIRRAISKFRD